jgi:hypothetical protein
VSSREQSAALLMRIALRVIQDFRRHIWRESNFGHQPAVTLDNFSLQTAGLAFYSQSVYNLL